MRRRFNDYGERQSSLPQFGVRKSNSGSTQQPMVEAPVEDHQPGADEKHAGQLKRAEPLPEKEEAEQNSARRHQQSDERRVGRARERHDAEEENIGKGGRQQRKAEDGEDRPERWHG